MVNTEVFATPLAWRTCAVESLHTVERLAQEMGLADRLHLWPDPDLGSKPRFLEMLRAGQRKHTTKQEREQWRVTAAAEYERHSAWLMRWWSRVSEWPGGKAAISHFS